MTSETLYGTWFEELTTLVVDVLVFFMRSIYFILESIYLTLLPNRFRKLKVSEP